MNYNVLVHKECFRAIIEMAERIKRKESNAGCPLPCIECALKVNAVLEEVVV